ncbi:ubiquitin-conjugating enzyme E2Q-like protein CG4502 [Protopterus annectens]|uniref:ubiquitin-conjugating enzyme E2Q-like protein CG4502 n=1 Tax=Protopterus annectens TaxID=7888 RepID=UPI001CF99C80|nr:ubiquitin-conjugating enzyme E2Q-like protein CG4502 [Protopterus annectens]
MATLLQKIGLIRLHERDTDDPKHHHHHQGSLKGNRGHQKSNNKYNSPGTDNTNIIHQGDKNKKSGDSQKDKQSNKEKHSNVKESKERQQGGNKTGSSSTAVQQLSTVSQQHSLIPVRQNCGQVRTKRLMKELQDIKKLTDQFIMVELVEDNLYEWNVKLHQVDKESALWQDMKETSTEFILLNLSFPDNFPFSPPFVRVLSPRLENSYVLDGGAICMELLTPRGWSSAYTVEAVMRQFAASLVKGQVRVTSC